MWSSKRLPGKVQLPDGHGGCLRVQVCLASHPFCTPSPGLRLESQLTIGFLQGFVHGAKGMSSVGSVINSLLTKVVINMLLTDSKHRPCLEFVVINTRM